MNANYEVVKLLVKYIFESSAAPLGVSVSLELHCLQIELWNLVLVCL